MGDNGETSMKPFLFSSSALWIIYLSKQVRTKWDLLSREYSLAFATLHHFFHWFPSFRLSRKQIFCFNRQLLCVSSIHWDEFGFLWQNHPNRFLESMSQDQNPYNNPYPPQGGYPSQQYGGFPPQPGKNDLRDKLLCSDVLIQLPAMGRVKCHFNHRLFYHAQLFPKVSCFAFLTETNREVTSNIQDTQASHPLVSLIFILAQWSCLHPHRLSSEVERKMMRGSNVREEYFRTPPISSHCEREIDFHLSFRWQR